MKILFVTGEFPPMQGGVGDYTRELGLALHDLGCHVHVATSTSAGPIPNLTVHSDLERWNWSCWPALVELVRGLQPDVVHIQYQAAAYAMHPAINLFPWRLKRLGPDRPRVVTTFHDLRVPYLFPKAGRMRRWVVDELAKRSDAVITTNREDYEFMQGRLASAPALIPIGSNIHPTPPANYDRDAVRARWGAGEDDLLLCFFGFVNDRKGVDTLLHSLALLVSEVQEPPSEAAGRRVNPVLLMLGGKTGASDPTNIAYLSHIESLVVDLGLAERIRWSGYLPPEEVTASFLASDLCVLPFRDGVSFLHGTFHAALAHGRPIVTTRPGVPLSELVDGGNICLVPPEQPVALADAIARLAASPALRATLGAGAQGLSARFQWDRIAADTLDLYGRTGAVA